MLTGVALGAMTLTLVIGLTMLVAMVRSGRPLPRLVYFHLASAFVALGGWTAYAVQDPRPRWLAICVLLVLLTTVMPAGDQLMLRHWRARATAAGRPTPNGARAYAAAAGDVLSFARPKVAFHALLAATGFFSVLLVTLGVAD
jgi:hypothetical protein